MISANEAREQTIYNINNNVFELNELEKQITKAVSEGRFSIVSNGYLQRNTIEEIKKLGYKVYGGEQYNEPYYRISWK